MHKPTATPSATSTRAAATTPGADRRLRLPDILKLLVNDGWVAADTADRLARTPGRGATGPLELIAEQKWHGLAPPHKLLTLEALVEWLAGKLGVPYVHVDPLKIDLVAVTQTMSNAYAERYRILPIEVTRDTLRVATSEPFVRAWADEPGE
ncbi:MAG: type II/IV secretion system protein, partial [Betaproteobacteria bacterium]|nr:type II/IV secretion system protein [Betaproteobacteria bacterium]